MYKYLNKTVIDMKNGFVTAQFKVNEINEANQLVNRFEGKVGVIGKQKLRVSCHNQSITAVTRDLFLVLNSKFESICEELSAKHRQHKLMIYTKQDKKCTKFSNVSIFITSTSDKVITLASRRL
jgi:hypothetical protein